MSGRSAFVSCLKNLLAQCFRKPEPGIALQRFQRRLYGRNQTGRFCAQQDPENPHGSKPKLNGAS